MVDLSRLIGITQIIGSVLAILLTLLYAMPLLIVPRLHHRLNIFPINVCAAIWCCSLFWIPFNLMSEVNIRQLYQISTCSLMLYAQVMCTLQVPLALVVVSIHRLCCVRRHNNIFYRSKRWMLLCVAVQWVVGMILPLPVLTRNPSVCAMNDALQCYVLLIIIVAPVLVCGAIHTIIFRTIRASSRRIQPTAERTTTTNRLTIEQLKMNRRDVHLLRHMIIMLTVFVFGWGPIYIASILQNHLAIDLRLFKSFALLANISLLCDILDLFLYCQKLREYLRRTMLPRCCA